jgi:hypothetical protein
MSTAQAGRLRQALEVESEELRQRTETLGNVGHELREVQSVVDEISSLVESLADGSEYGSLDIPAFIADARRLLVDAGMPHDWLHDGYSRGEGGPDGGRLCRRCRFRENVLDEAGRHKLCFGDDALFRHGERVGRVQGSRERAAEISERLGLR